MDETQNHGDDGQEALQGQDGAGCRSEGNAEAECLAEAQEQEICGQGEPSQQAAAQAAQAKAEPASGEFKEHFAKLSKCVDTLRSQTSADLDELLPLVDEALASYKFCKSRIESVKALLDERLSAAKEENERGG